MSNETTFYFSRPSAVMSAVMVLRGVPFRYCPFKPTPSNPAIASITFDLEYEDCVKEILKQKEVPYRIAKFDNE